MNARLARTTLALAMLSPMTGWSAVMLVIDIVPPPLPMYAQPPVPGDGYLWTPGYWGWNERARDYNWVPGTWVRPPKVNFLWTPGYWAFQESSYRWHTGYWGPRVGYYGGLNYGYGYGGNGYEGGRWDHGYFRYNQAVNNVPAGGVYRVYNAPVIVRNQASRARATSGGIRLPMRSPPPMQNVDGQAEAHAGSTLEQVNHEKMACSHDAGAADVREPRCPRPWPRRQGRPASASPAHGEGPPPAARARARQCRLRSRTGRRSQSGWREARRGRRQAGRREASTRKAALEARRGRRWKALSRP